MMVKNKKLSDLKAYAVKKYIFFYKKIKVLYDAYSLNPKQLKSKFDKNLIQISKAWIQQCDAHAEIMHLRNAWKSFIINLQNSHSSEVNKSEQIDFSDLLRSVNELLSDDTLIKNDAEEIKNSAHGSKNEGAELNFNPPLFPVQKKVKSNP